MHGVQGRASRVRKEVNKIYTRKRWERKHISRVNKTNNEQIKLHAQV